MPVGVGSLPHVHAVSQKLLGYTHRKTGWEHVAHGDLKVSLERLGCPVQLLWEKFQKSLVLDMFIAVFLTTYFLNILACKNLTKLVYW